jgi:prepilin-type N-terminal cleavage/methylation domain-containing protein/prepilin-type processing-associated H-X9-DG protein
MTRSLFKPVPYPRRDFTLIEMLAVPAVAVGKRERRQWREAFTLIEMLVVIAIIALLASLIIPATNQALVSARRMSCASNLRQLAMSSLMYSSENNGRLIATPFVDSDVYWFRQIYPYLGNEDATETTQIFQCVEDKDAQEAYASGGTEWDSISYLLLKENLSWNFLEQIRSPSTSPQFIDAEITATGNYRSDDRFENVVKGSQAKWRHGRGMNVAYWDGRVAFVENPTYSNMFLSVE